MANATAISKVSFKTDSYMQITVELSFIEAKHVKSGTIVVAFGHATIVSNKKIIIQMNPMAKDSLEEDFYI